MVLCTKTKKISGVGSILKMITFFCMILKVLQCSLSSQKNVPCQKDTPAHFRPPEPQKRILLSPFAKPDFLFCQTWLFLPLSLHSIFSSVQCECWRATYIRCKTHTVPAKASNRDWDSIEVGLDFQMNLFKQVNFSWGQGVSQKKKGKSPRLK